MISPSLKSMSISASKLSLIIKLTLMPYAGGASRWVHQDGMDPYFWLPEGGFPFLLGGSICVLIPKSRSKAWGHLPFHLGFLWHAWHTAPVSGGAVSRQIPKGDQLWKANCCAWKREHRKAWCSRHPGSSPIYKTLRTTCWKCGKPVSCLSPRRVSWVLQQRTRQAARRRWAASVPHSNRLSVQKSRLLESWGRALPTPEGHGDIKSLEPKGGLLLDPLETQLRFVAVLLLYT